MYLIEDHAKYNNILNNFETKNLYLDHASFQLPCLFAHFFTDIWSNFYKGQVHLLQKIARWNVIGMISLRNHIGYKPHHFPSHVRESEDNFGK